MKLTKKEEKQEGIEKQKIQGAKEKIEKALMNGYGVETIIEILGISKEKVAKARMIYESRQAEISDQLTRIKSAKERGIAAGIKEGKIELAIELLKNGESIEKIIKYLKLSREEILELASTDVDI